HSLPHATMWSSFGRAPVESDAVFRIRVRRSRRDRRRTHESTLPRAVASLRTFLSEALQASAATQARARRTRRHHRPGATPLRNSRAAFALRHIAIARARDNATRSVRQ